MLYYGHWYEAKLDMIKKVRRHLSSTGLRSGLAVAIVLLAGALFTGSVYAASQLGTWNSTTVIPDSLSQATSVSYNGYVYELGGDDNSGIVNTVYYAPLNPNGTVGTWNTTTVLPDALSAATSVVYNGFIYELGGVDNSGTVNTVYYAPLNPNGTVGAWSTTTVLPDSLSYASAVVNNGFVYELGGGDNGGNVNTVYYAPLHPNGTVGTWNTTTVLPDFIVAATSVVNNGYVYEIAGQNNTDNTATVYYAPLNSNGTVGAWSTTTSLPDILSFAGSVVSDNYVYELGGADDSGSVDTVYYAPLNPNGTVGSWSATTALPSVLTFGTSVVSNGYIYELGGADGSGVTATVYSSAIQSDLPSATTNGNSGSTLSSVPRAPDTGYGTPDANVPIVLITLVTLPLAVGLSIYSYRRSRRLS